MKRLIAGSGIILFGAMMILSGWKEVLLLRISSIIFLILIGILMLQHNKELNDALLVLDDEVKG